MNFPPPPPYSCTFASAREEEGGRRHEREGEKMKKERKFGRVDERDNESLSLRRSCFPSRESGCDRKSLGEKEHLSLSL